MPIAWGGGAFLAFFAAAEILAGIWLLTEFLVSQARWIGFLLFSAFLGASLAYAFAGELSCRCFGALSLSPWWTAALDACVAGALFVVICQAARGQRLRFTLTTLTLAAAMGSTGALSARALDPAIAPPPGAVVLTPSTWQQKAHCIFEDADKADDLRSGEWIIMVYRRGCPACARALPPFCQEAARAQERGGQPLRFALLLLPEESLDYPRQHILVARLRGERPWIVSAPLFLRTHDGRVTAASATMPSLDGWAGVID